MDFQNQFHLFAPVLSSLPTDFAGDIPLPASLRIAGDGRFDVFYAPFDHVNPEARVVLVGITPGQVQAIEAIGTARRCLLAGMSEGEACERAKSAASFAGPMRSNLVLLLDHIGLAERLGLRTAAELWSSRTDLVQFTSACATRCSRQARTSPGRGSRATPCCLSNWTPISPPNALPYPRHCSFPLDRRRNRPVTAWRRPANWLTARYCEACHIRRAPTPSASPTSSAARIVNSYR